MNQVSIDNILTGFVDLCFKKSPDDMFIQYILDSWKLDAIGIMNQITSL